MLFNSIDFFIFLIIVFIIYWSLNNKLKLQNILLLISSYVFYAWWDWRFLSLIIASSIIDFTVGKKIFNSKSDKHRKRWLIVSLVSNLGILSFFKYYNFFANSFSDMVSLFGWQPNDLTLNIILPVGISFYTFQTLSYTIDIYRKQFEPTNDIISFFTYIAFFPQLVAGPIERASNLLPQMQKKRVFDRTMFKEGIIQIAVGLFRKIVIADNVGPYVDTIYENTGIYNSTTIILATFLYSFQVFYDFAGYSDIAIGTAKLIGFRFNRNFNLPYFAKSFREFWGRWHISLSHWLRDYLYIPLGGNRKGKIMTYRNLMLTMLLGGLWHGSSWNFVIWGGLNGVALSIERLIFSRRKKRKIDIGVLNYLGFPITFCIITFTRVFFRAQDLSSATAALKQVLKFDFSMPFIGDINILATSGLMIFIGTLFDFYLFKKNIYLEDLGGKLNIAQVTIFTSVVIVLINLFYSTANNFIYFQF